MGCEQGFYKRELTQLQSSSLEWNRPDIVSFLILRKLVFSSLCSYLGLGEHRVPRKGTDLVL